MVLCKPSYWGGWGRQPVWPLSEALSQKSEIKLKKKVNYGWRAGRSAQWAARGQPVRGPALVPALQNQKPTKQIQRKTKNKTTVFEKLQGKSLWAWCAWSEGNFRSLRHCGNPALSTNFYRRHNDSDFIKLTLYFSKEKHVPNAHTECSIFH